MEVKESPKISYSEVEKFRREIDDWVAATISEPVYPDILVDFGVSHPIQLEELGVDALVDSFVANYELDLTMGDLLSSQEPGPYPTGRRSQFPGITWCKHRHYWKVQCKDNEAKRARIFNPGRIGRLPSLRQAIRFYCSTHPIKPITRKALYPGIKSSKQYFIVKWERNGIKKTKCFLKKKANSLNQAIEFKKQIEKVAEIDDDVQSRLVNKLNPQKGVRYCKSRNTWIAEYKKQCRYFPVNKFREHAIEMAGYARNQALSTGVLPSYHEVQLCFL